MALDLDAIAAKYGGTAIDPAAPAMPTQATGGNQLSGDQYLATLPQKAQGLVKAYAEGKLPISPMMVRSPAGISLLGAITQYDPTFDATDYNKRNRTAIGFATGTQGNAVKAANQAISHMGQFNQAIDDLNNFNGVATPLNSIVNPIESALGDPRQGVFSQKAQAISSELRKVFSGSGGGGLAELQKWESSLPTNASQQQQRAYLRSGLDLLHGALDALNNQYQQGFGPKAKIDDLLSPESRQTLDKLGGISTDGMMGASSAAQPSMVNQIPGQSSALTGGGWSAVKR